MINGSGWRHDYSGGTDVKPPGWYIRLIQDTTFANELACRYFNLRNTILDTTQLFTYIDSLGNVVDAAQERHYVRWPILGINVGTPEVGTQPTTYAGEITKFKGWILDRLNWLDANMPGNCPNVGIEETQSKAPYFVVYPNPVGDLLNVYADEPIDQLELYDISGKLVWTITAPGQNLVTVNMSQLSGIFTLRVQLSSKKVLIKKVVRY
jgi:hypothetical protein